jgi:hypothetical protein
MLGGKLVFAWADAPDVLKFYFEYAREMPDELNVDAALFRLPDDQRMLSFDVCYWRPA